MKTKMKKSLKRIGCMSLAGMLIAGSISGYVTVPKSMTKAEAKYDASKSGNTYKTKKKIYVQKKSGKTYKYYTYKGKKIRLAKSTSVTLLKKVTVKKASWGYVKFTYKKKSFKGYIPMSALKAVKKVAPTAKPTAKPTATPKVTKTPEIVPPTILPTEVPEETAQVTPPAPLATNIPTLDTTQIPILETTNPTDIPGTPVVSAGASASPSAEPVNDTTPTPSNTETSEITETPIITETPTITETPDVGKATAIPQDPLKSEPTKLSESMNYFAYQLFAQMENETNTCFSPYSIHMAFSMLDNGASGETKKQIEKALGISDLDAWNESMNTLASQLTGRESKLLTANKMWISNNAVLNPNIQKEFKDPLKQYYNADVDMVAGFGEDTKKVINQWVEEHTDQQIKGIADQLERDTVFALVNAVYFSGQWKQKFDVFATEEATFTNKDGSESKVQMMNLCDKSFQYAENKQVSMLQLPYGENGDTVMDIILSKDTTKTLGETYGAMTYKEREALFEEIDRATVTEFEKIGIPKFELSTDTMRLKNALTMMGMGQVFEQNTTDYSRIGDVFVDEVFHKAKVAVNEGGTTASAATLVAGKATATQPSDKVFIADAPFIFVIRDKKTDTILFMGEVNQLSDKESKAADMKPLKAAKAETIAESKEQDKADSTQVITSYQQLQDFINTIDASKTKVLNKLKSYNEKYFESNILLYGSMITDLYDLSLGDITVVDGKDCYAKVQKERKGLLSEEDYFKLTYYGFTIELPKNETTTAIESFNLK